ncbi:MAG: hypothetical protein AAFX99_04710 [Myxococcota bacterium]
MMTTTTRPTAVLAALITLLLAALILPLSTATADDFDPAERGRIEMLLLPYDHSPDAKAFKAVATDPQAHLLDIVRSPDTRELLRLQAIVALSHFPNAKTLKAYTDIIAAAGLTDPGSRALHRTLQSLAFGFGTRALPHLEPLLAHSDPQVRLTVVHAMAHTGDKGKAKLRDHLNKDKENDPLVQETLEKLAATLR